MSSQAEIGAEELVFEVAEELGLTEVEVLEIDVLAIAEGVLRHVRTELKKQSGRTLTSHDYFPPGPSPDALRGLI